VTSFDALNEDIIVSWIAPDNGGSPITSYTIELRHYDEASFSTELVYCDGSIDIIRTST
jgi:hypothetical protein